MPVNTDHNENKKCTKSNCFAHNYHMQLQVTQTEHNVTRTCRKNIIFSTVQKKPRDGSLKESLTNVHALSSTQT